MTPGKHEACLPQKDNFVAVCQLIELVESNLLESDHVWSSGTLCRREHQTLRALGLGAPRKILYNEQVV